MDISNEATPNPYLYKLNGSLEEILVEASKLGIGAVSITLTATNGSIPATHPKLLKEAIAAQVPSHNNIDFLKITRQGKLLVRTLDAETAIQMFTIKTLFNIPVSASFQTECLSTRFLLHNISPLVDCREIADELAYVGIKPLEVRRFLKNGSTPTSSVLVTKLGYSLPSDIKLWYQVHRITLFVDKPRQCTNCLKFTHNTRACKSTRVCGQCGITHDGTCSTDSPMCANCKGNHVSSDKSCPHYKQEAKLLAFKAENHLTFSEARRQFRVSIASKAESYAAAVASTSACTPTPTDYVTKTDLQELLQCFTDNMVSLLQQVVDSQKTNCQELLNSLTTTVIDAVKDTLTADVLPPKPSPSDKRSEAPSPPHWTILKSEKAKKLKMALSSKGLTSDPLMDTSTPESWIPDGLPLREAHLGSTSINT